MPPRPIPEPDDEEANVCYSWCDCGRGGLSSSLGSNTQEAPGNVWRRPSQLTSVHRRMIRLCSVALRVLDSKRADEVAIYGPNAGQRQIGVLATTRRRGSGLGLSNEARLRSSFQYHKWYANSEGQITSTVKSEVLRLAGACILHWTRLLDWSAPDFVIDQGDVLFLEIPSYYVLQGCRIMLCDPRVETHFIFSIAEYQYARAIITS